MALVKCPECGRGNVSDSAEACPDCGYGLKAHFEKIRKEQEEQRIQKRLASGKIGKQYKCKNCKHMW